MSWTDKKMSPTVVSGNVETDALNYKLGATQSFKAGELIRLTSAGTVKVALPAASAAGAVHGIALANAGDFTAGDVFPVALVDADTVLAIKLASAKDQNDVEAGEVSALAVASNAWTVADSATNPTVMIYGKPADAQWFDPDMEASLDGAPIYVQVLASVLVGRSA